MFIKNKITLSGFLDRQPCSISVLYHKFSTFWNEMVAAPIGALLAFKAWVNLTSLPPPSENTV